jgi:hypothetical protein
MTDSGDKPPADPPPWIFPLANVSRPMPAAYIPPANVGPGAVPAWPTEMPPEMPPEPEGPDRTGTGSRAPLILLAVLIVAIIAVCIYLVRSFGSPEPVGVQTRPGATAPSSSPEAEPDVDSEDGTDLLSEGTVTADDHAGPSADDSGATTSFEPANLTDGRPETAWRMAGDGTGSTITIGWDRKVTISSVGLINGYAKIDPSSGKDRYRQQRRVLAVTWTIGKQSVRQTLTDNDTDLQSLELKKPLVGEGLELRIERVTRPGDRDYTAISELSVIGR